MANLVEMIDKKFGRLTVIRRANDWISGNNRIVVYECSCSCGNTRVVPGYRLRSGQTRSCGCISTKHHGKRDYPRLYETWKNMKRRCSDPSNKRWENYGGKGVKVCDEWNRDFKAFRDWSFSHGYQDNLTIDRIDINGDYCPENCRWADAITQQNNTSRNAWVVIRGEKMTLANAARKLNLSYSTVAHRYQRGQEIDAPPKRKRVKNESASISNGCITSD